MSEFNQPTVPTSSPGSDRSWAAIVSLVVGIVSLCAWFVPLFGCPTTVVGLIFGFLGVNTERKTLAYIGIALSALGLIATIINAAVGAYLGATGQNPLLNQFLGQ